MHQHKMIANVAGEDYHICMLCGKTSPARADARRRVLKAAVIAGAVMVVILSVVGLTILAFTQWWWVSASALFLLFASLITMLVLDEI